MTGWALGITLLTVAFIVLVFAVALYRSRPVHPLVWILFAFFIGYGGTLTVAAIYLIK